MLNNEKLIRKIDFLKVQDIYSILIELSPDFIHNSGQNIEDYFQEETIKVDQKILEELRDLFKILVKNSDEFAKKIEDILTQNKQQTSKDITIIADGMTALIPLKEIGLFLTFLLARDLIKAFNPSEEIEKTKKSEKDSKVESKKIVRRQYNVDLINLAKAYFESKKGK